MTEKSTNNFIHSTMYVIGSQVYEDEEIMEEYDEYAPESVYDSHPDEYIYEDPMDLISIAFLNAMDVNNITVS